MRKPIVRNIYLDQNAEFNLSFRWTAGGSPVDMTGWTAKMHLRKTSNSTSIVHALTTENGQIILSNDGLITLNIPAPLTGDLAPGSGVFDLFLIPTADTARRFLMGRYTICLLYTSPSPRDLSTSRMPSSA